jgi:putative DNA primase/helicase
MRVLNIPEELKSHNSWVGWVWAQKKNSRGEMKWTKPPYDLKSDGELRHAAANDPTTWASFEVAETDCSAFNPRFDGIGLVLPAGMGGLDFDGVVHEEQVEPFVLEILKHCGNPYAEFTPSGGGVRAFINAPTLPADKKRKFSGKKEGVDKYGAEIYFGAEPGRYLTVTANKLPDSGDGLTTPLDIDLVHFLVSQIGNEKLKSLWMGDLSEYNNDQSAADLALLNILKRLFNSDAQKMERYFSASLLGQREKWTQREDYRKRTIARALDGETVADTSNESGAPATRAKSSKPADQGFTSRLISGTADQITLKRVVWLWLNRFAQKLNLLVGNPDQGKGLITQYVVACLTTGRDWFGCKNTLPPSEALVMANEDDWNDTIAPRLVAAGADMSKVHWIKIEDTFQGKKAEERDLQLDRDAARLEEFLTDHPAVRLVVVDPISNYLGNVKMIDEQSVRAKILMPIKSIASRKEVAVIAVMHMNKKIELDAIYRTGGALAFTGVARMAWLVAPAPNNEDGTKSDELLMVKIKGNIVSRDLKGLSFKIVVRSVMIEGVSTPTPYIAWVGEVDNEANDLTGRASATHEAHRKAEQLPAAERWLFEYLKDGAKPLSDIENDGKALHGFTAKTIQRARDAAGIITFKNGETYKARDGKKRPIYACRLSEATMEEQNEPGF